MDISLWFVTTIQTFASVLHQWPLSLLVIDILTKSLVLLAVFFLLDRIFRTRVSSASRHFLWLNAILCLAILPLLPALYWLLSDSNGAEQGNVASALFELSVLPGQQSTSARLPPGMGLMLMYLIPAAVMLGRLAAAVARARRLARQAKFISEPATLQLLARLQKQLNVSGRVQLRCSDAIQSPVSLGLFTPVIILPPQANDWNDSIMTDVLLHELCHIRRLDWLTTLLCHLIACIYWINRLVWHAVRQVRDESEHSCDTAVLAAGRSDTDYAESLLSVATCCRHTHHRHHKSYPLVQTMLDQNSLTTRISRVLEENKIQASKLKQEITRSAALLLVLSAGIVGVLSTTQVLSAQEVAAQDMAGQEPASPPSPPPVTRPAPPPGTDRADGELFPLHTEEAVYPRVAADDGIDGWVQVSFTVSADGSVPAGSVSVIDAEPADVFNNSAVNAAAKFRFSPRMVDGEGVAVDNAQYVFRYRLSQESTPDPATNTPD